MPGKRAIFHAEDMTKTCAKCGNRQPSASFFKHAQTSDGFHSWCKNCCRAGNDKSRSKLYSTFDGRINTFLRNCRNSAKKRGNEFSLTEDDLQKAWELQYGLCAYTGIEMTTQPNLPHTVSVERIDSSIGYTKANTILVCHAINVMKSDLDGELFFDMCKSVVKWLGNESQELAVEFKKYG